MADWLAQAMAAQQAGNIERAVSRFEKFLKRQPRRVDVMQHLAMLCREHGDAKRALRWMKEARRAAPDDPQVLASLGTVLLGGGKADEAVKHFQRAVALRPEHAGTLFNLALALDAAGRAGEGVDPLAAAARLVPNDAGVKRELSRALLGAGRVDEARVTLRGALRLAPQDVATRCRLAELALAAGDLPEAEALLTDSVSETEAPAILALTALRVRLQLASGQQAAAVALLGKVPDDVYPSRLSRASLLALVAALGEAGEGGQTLRLLEAAAAATPQDAGLLTLLSQARSAKGDHKDALAAASAAIAAAASESAEQARAWYQFSRVRRFPPGDAADGAQLDALQRMLDGLDDGQHKQRADLGFALGKAREDRGEAAAAFAAYCTANEANVRSTHAYDRAAREDEVSRLLALVTPVRIDRWREAAVPSQRKEVQRPILIVGMPRSGTTLVEQILAAHPDVCAGGERPYLPARVRALATSANTGADGQRWLDGLRAADTPALRALAVGYLSDLDAHRREPACRVTDKLPGNYMHAALVTALLPDAHIVLCTRDQRDVGWSNFTQRFASGHGYASDLGDLGFELVQYARVVSHWRDLFDHRLHEVRNEVLIADTEREVRALLDACKLPFDARCLAHHEQGGVVGTASDAQVHEPVSARSIGRHVPFTEWLGPLFEQLAKAEDGSW